MKRIFILFLYFITNATYSNYNQSNNIKSWKEIKDRNIIKQENDFSCGAASIATILNSYYNIKITEAEVLKLMTKNESMTSFDDMQNALLQLGYQSQGYALSYEMLMNLRVPAIVYVKHRKNDHFTVINGINKDFVKLADPSLGNITLSKYAFLKIWNTRNDQKYIGKILIIYPNKGSEINPLFFTKNIKQPSRLSLKLIYRKY